MHMEDGSANDKTLGYIIFVSLGYIIFVSNQKYLADHAENLFGSSN